MKKYFYFGKAPNGAFIPLFELVSDVDPMTVQINTIYRQFVAQHGLGVPRPTHYAVMELYEVEQTDEVEDVAMVAHGGLVN